MPTADLKKADQVDWWLLVGLLNQQPAKFGKLLLALKESDSDLAAIERVYGWNEKELGRRWRTYVMNLPKPKAAGKRN